MLKASALYIVIIIALVIAVLCSALIVTAYYYTIQNKKKIRYDRLENNLNSGINILLASGDSQYQNEKIFSLFNNNEDSVALKTLPWGIFEIGIAKSFLQKDTLYKSFSIANSVDSSKWAALYLIDEDRPFSLSGKTAIRGHVFIPKAGVQQAYIDNKAYQGDKRLIIGTKHTSERRLPPLDQNRLNQLEQYFNQLAKANSTLPKSDTISNSFLLPTKTFNFGKTAQTIQNTTLIGNIILRSDTTITFDSTSKLNNVLVFARVIVVKNGFQGNCQLFATDSISVGNSCKFNYPSCLGVMRFQSSIVSSQVKISINEGTEFNGSIFTYEKIEKPVKPLIFISKNVKIMGQVYSQGIVELKDNTEIDGSIFTSRFLYKSSFTLYENYLINTTIDEKALSPYYLTSGLIPVASKKKKILQWLEAN